jgi:hypothetical protein
MGSSSRQQSLQKLYVHLLFSSEIQRRWASDKEGLLVELNLDLESVKSFPSIEGKGFLAESHGRKFMVTRILGKRYPRLLEAVLAVEPEAPVIVSSVLMTNFFGSCYFLTSRHCIEHYSGIGRGYEAISKFYFWCRRLEPEFSPHQMFLLNLEFAYYLVAQARHAEHGFFKRARRGVAFHDPRYDPTRWVVCFGDGRAVSLSIKNSPDMEFSDALILDRFSQSGDYPPQSGNNLEKENGTELDRTGNQIDGGAFSPRYLFCDRCRRAGQHH